MTEGERIAHDLARRIDAALAELAARVERLDVQLAGCGSAAIGWIQEPATPDQYGWSRAYQDVLELRQKWNAGEKALAEREAQCVALHGALRVGVEFVKNGAPNEHFMEWARNADRVCGSIADAACAFVERIRREKLDECCRAICLACREDWPLEGERHRVKGNPLPPFDYIGCGAADIRALK